MRLIYSFIMYLLAPLFFIRLWWKGRACPSYRERLGERLCLSRTVKTYDIWFHVVSLGEAMAAIPLIQQLLDQHYQILVTTITPSGAEKIQNQFKASLTHRYLPYDLPDVTKRFFKLHRFRLGIIVETELWPNLIIHAKRANRTLFLINARLSMQSFNRYKKIKRWMHTIVRQFDGIYAQGAADAKRFIALGANQSNVFVKPNIKFDLMQPSCDKAYQALKHQWGVTRPVFILASTHDNEEALILAQWQKLKKILPELIILIAPRHAERFQIVYEMVKHKHLKVGLTSLKSTINAETEVVIINSYGELLNFYAISDYAFVGGSLVPRGAQNVLEPIALNTPVIVGPYTFNFQTICDELKQKSAIKQISTAEEIPEVLTHLQHQQTHDTLVANAYLVFKRYQGVVSEYITLIDGVLKAKHHEQ
ncbi:MAG: 3-deoxy-D-manno-octulosonic acid transferase [Legionellaceae bacterium]|nr:3-deoxy-D-manno-octulosonic acid transferase [Legionellaceae bacterium]|tara:strand:- start:6877 stop:8142 length:1266 start_codon:yes stop_codon:yes gene_type:complete